MGVTKLMTLKGSPEKTAGEYLSCGQKFTTKTRNPITSQLGRIKFLLWFRVLNSLISFWFFSSCESTEITGLLSKVTQETLATKFSFISSPSFNSASSALLNIAFLPNCSPDVRTGFSGIPTSSLFICFIHFPFPMLLNGGPPHSLVLGPL